MFSLLFKAKLQDQICFFFLIKFFISFGVNNNYDIFFEYNNLNFNQAK